MGRVNFMIIFLIGTLALPDAEEIVKMFPNIQIFSFTLKLHLHHLSWALEVVMRTQIPGGHLALSSRKLCDFEQVIYLLYSCFLIWQVMLTIELTALL